MGDRVRVVICDFENTILDHGGSVAGAVVRRAPTLGLRHALPSSGFVPGPDEELRAAKPTPGAFQAVHLHRIHRGPFGEARPIGTLDRPLLP
ncbi:MAG: hypothetical protein ACLQOZ_15610 [Acidimicrobiales bacterium]|jgi:hypothetical protein